jgi:radical SAM protein with 4Fe4S-binding SPASM domain
MRLADNDPDRVWTDMDPNLFDKISTQVFPMAHTVGLSCGAEPFCNDFFPRYLDRLYNADVPIRELVTNGTLMSGKFVDALLKTPPTSVTVSIDGSRKETHAEIRGGADLDEILSNVRELVNRRNRSGKRFPMVSFSMTLQRKNLDELLGVVSLANEVGAESVGIVPLVPYQGLETGDQVIDMEAEKVEHEIKAAGEAASLFGIDLIVAGNTTGETNCSYPWNWVFIDPQGNVNPCPYWNTSNPIGNLNLQDFRSIWNGNNYLALRQRLKTGELTGNCRICPINASGREEIPKV